MSAGGFTVDGAHLVRPRLLVKFIIEAMHADLDVKALGGSRRPSSPWTCFFDRRGKQALPDVSKAGIV